MGHAHAGSMAARKLAGQEADGEISPNRNQQRLSSDKGKRAFKCDVCKVDLVSVRSPLPGACIGLSGQAFVFCAGCKAAFLTGCTRPQSPSGRWPRKGHWAYPHHSGSSDLPNDAPFESRTRRA